MLRSIGIKEPIWPSDTPEYRHKQRKRASGKGRDTYMQDYWNYLTDKYIYEATANGGDPDVYKAIIKKLNDKWKNYESANEGFARQRLDMLAGTTEDVPMNIWLKDLQDITAGLEETLPPFPPTDLPPIYENPVFQPPPKNQQVVEDVAPHPTSIGHDIGRTGTIRGVTGDVHVTGSGNMQNRLVSLAVKEKSLHSEADH
jgi:hypothetical protein